MLTCFGSRTLVRQIAVAGLAVTASFTVYAATNPPQYTGELTIAACYNQTNGQVRIVKPWGPDPECIPPDSTGGGTCTEGGQFDCKVNEFFVELNTQGPKGDTGPMGPQGPKGDAGPIGPTGPQGPQGYSATVSPPDANGCYQITIVDEAHVPVPAFGSATVCNGAPGRDGKDGAPGADGAAGAPGQAATITIGTTSTVEAGTSASVTNSGTGTTAVLDFSIPQGPKGDKGDPGAPAPGDNLGNHSATTNLNMNFHDIFNARTIRAEALCLSSGNHCRNDWGTTGPVLIPVTLVTGGGSKTLNTTLGSCGSGDYLGQAVISDAWFDLSGAPPTDLAFRLVVVAGSTGGNLGDTACRFAICDPTDPTGTAIMVPAHLKVGATVADTNWSVGLTIRGTRRVNLYGTRWNASSCTFENAYVLLLPLP